MALFGRAGRAGSLRGKRALQLTTRAREIASAAPAIQEYPQHELPPVQSSVLSRQESIKNAKPFSSFLTDTFQRQHDYLRISITEKCNLRCLYCMPEEGVPQSPPEHLLTTPEIFLLSSVFVQQGVTKIRLTGGEPTVRRDILPLMHQIGSLRSLGLRELCLTTNGLSLHRKLDSMVEAGLTGINLSLDTLDPFQFQIMTRRKGFEAVMKSIERILEMNRLGAGIKLKINCVVMRGLNEREILPFVELGRKQDLEVRFIEYMPFDGNKWSQGKMLSYQEMLDIIKAKYPELRKVQDQKNDTSKTYKVPGFVGRMGFITSMTHNFCGSCNRLRITSDGNLKVCLFGNAEVSLRDILRKRNEGRPIDEQAFEAMKQFEMDHRQRISSAQGPLGGTKHEQELLEVIGLAVSRKKAKHAGMGELENMKNRPMILIDEPFPPKPTFITIKPRSLTSHPPPWQRIPLHLLQHPLSSSSSIRLYSTSTKPIPSGSSSPSSPQLTHTTSHGTAHIVPIHSKPVTSRQAIAVCTLHFSNHLAIPLIRSNTMKKGDVLSVARIAGIMAAKKTSEVIPLCHNIGLSFVGVELEVFDEQTTVDENVQSAKWAGTGQGDAYSWHESRKKSEMTGEGKQFGRIEIKATVECEGKTGVEMEALTAASVAGLTVYDMCKAVDKGMWIEGLRVVRKEGGKSGLWVEGVSVDENKEKVVGGG